MQLSTARNFFVGAGFLLALVACSGRPVLYPNEHLRRVGNTAADQDIDDCMRQAEQSRPAINASAEQASEVGTSVSTANSPFNGVPGLLGKTELSSPQKAFVNKCLRDKGYDPVAWN